MRAPVVAFSQDGSVFRGKRQAGGVAYQRPHCLCYALYHKQKVDHSSGMCQAEMFHYSTWKKLTHVPKREGTG